MGEDVVTLTTLSPMMKEKKKPLRAGPVFLKGKS